MSWPAPVYLENGMTTAKRVSLPVLTAPIPSTTARYILTEDWMQRLTDATSFSPLALNSTHPEYTNGVGSYTGPTFYLVSESPLKDSEGGVVRWTRTYAAIPATHYEDETYNYNFIASTVNLGAGILTTPRHQARVTSRIVHDYFLVGTGGSYANEGLIPKIFGMVYVFQAVDVAHGSAVYGGISMPTESLEPSGATLPTWPTSDQYNAQVADALTNLWGATLTVVTPYASNTLAGGPPPTSGHMAGVINTGSSTLGGLMPAEDSSISRWMGNIWLRRTRQILAQ